MLLLDRVSKNFAGRCIIESVSLRVAAGEILCLSGPSGVGKSTLLELMAGVTEPDTGSIARGGPVALAFQDDALIPWQTAAVNVAYALSKTVSPKERDAKSHAWLERFGLEGHSYPAAMSGGMRRRLGMARAFASERPIVLLDEPFAFLDPDWQARIVREIAHGAEQGTCFVLTSHAVEPLAAYPHRRIDVIVSPVRIDG